MEEKFTPDFSGPSFKQALFFELSSLIGRKFKRKRSKILPTHSPLLIDIGVGENYTKGWVHVDFYRFQQLKFWKNSKILRPEVETDLRFPLNCNDNIVDGIYCGHTIEHLYPKEAYQLLKEIFRILKPGCWLRINFPDLKKFIDCYNGVASDPNFLIFKTGCEAVSTITQNYGHHSAWDYTLMAKALESVGYQNIKSVRFGIEGSDKKLIKEEEIRKWESLVIEAQKPL